MQLKSGDFLSSAANLNPKTTPENISIVAIDDKSINQLGHLSSWPRSYHAHLIDILAKSKARVIVLDVLFSELTPYDEEMATSIRNAGNVIIPLVYTSVAHQFTMTGETLKFASVLNPVKPFAEMAAAIGHANVIPDEDGVVRRLPIVVHSGDGYQPALALATVANYLRCPQVIQPIIKDNRLPFAGRLIPLDTANSMVINYTGDSAAPLSFKTISYVDVLKGNTDSTDFQDKIIIVGATATGLGDTFWTPMGQMMSGVEIHASAVHNILTANFLKPAPDAVTIMLILASALICGLIVLHVRILWATLGCVSVGVAYFLIAFYFFDNGLVLNMFYPPLTIVSTFAGLNLYNIAVERTEKREITKTFGRYVSPPVAESILASLREGELRLGGEEHDVTVMFADVRDFTGIAEKVPPEELVRMLNDYLSQIIEAILKYDGIINKFGGDSIMAIWNVPAESQEHALLATKAAVSAQRAITELHKSETTPLRMEFGIGINTGKAIAGNMGSVDRLEYSVIGDVVNNASRLASIAPGGRIWISAETFDLVREHVTTKPLGLLTLKGKREPVRAYEVSDKQN